MGDEPEVKEEFGTARGPEETGGRGGGDRSRDGRDDSRRGDRYPDRDRDRCAAQCQGGLMGLSLPPAPKAFIVRLGQRTSTCMHSPS